MRLIRVSDCPAGQGRFVEVAGRELAVFHVLGVDGAKFAVTDNSCPHANGNLSAGELDGAVVTCPWHQWQFDVTTGACLGSATARVPCYPAAIRDGHVWVDLERPDFRP